MSCERMAQKIMSGDVQPRKRKDRRKKIRDELDEIDFEIPNTYDVKDDEIEEHFEEKKVGTCANVTFILFFMLLAGGVTFICASVNKPKEVDTPLSQSRFASVFEGLVDEIKPTEDSPDNNFCEVSGQNEGMPCETLDLENGEQDTPLEESHDDGEVMDIVDQELSRHEDILNVDDNIESFDAIEKTINNELYQSTETGAVDDIETVVDELITGSSEKLSARNEKETSSIELDTLDTTDSKHWDAHQDEVEVENSSAEEIDSSDITESNHWDSQEKLDQEKVEAKINDISYKSYHKNYQTNEDDWEIHEELDEIDAALENANTSADVINVLMMINKILKEHPNSVRGLIAKGLGFDKLSELERSNQYLDVAIKMYIEALQKKNIPDALFNTTTLHCASRMQFRGMSIGAIEILNNLVERFAENVFYRNKLAIAYLMSNQHEEAKKQFELSLQLDPENNVALAHKGFILKVHEDNYEEGAKLLLQGMSSGDPEVQDGRFYFHLGDALSRIGQLEKARETYIQGEKMGLFLSRDQRSLYNVDRLTGRPWWTPEETTYADDFKMLEDNFDIIRKEATSLIVDENNAGFLDEAESLLHTGSWKQLDLWSRGKKNVKGCAKTPKTCELLSNFKAATQCTRGQIKFSIMHPNTHVYPHAGPTNCRIRAHLGIVVPEGPALRVLNDTKVWKEGKFIIFDDSFEHEVWHNGSTYRLVLIIDVWHPELTQEERMTLHPV